MYELKYYSFMINAVLFSIAFFVCGSFAGEANTTEQKADYFWPNKEQVNDIKKMLDLNYIPIRFKYFSDNNSRSWLLKEYGKEQLIDFKVIVRDKKIVSIDVLEYRESYGGEIKRSTFRRQFVDAFLEKMNDTFKLSKHIDGISGATISVDASRNIAKLALFLDSKLNE